MAKRRGPVIAALEGAAASVPAGAIAQFHLSTGQVTAVFASRRSGWPGLPLVRGKDSRSSSRPLFPAPASRQCFGYLEDLT